MLRRVIMRRGGFRIQTCFPLTRLFSSISEKNGTPKWLKAVLKLPSFAESASPVNIERWKEGMKNLEDVGCHSYQILEAPVVLNLTEDDLFKRMDELHQAEIEAISVPIIAIARHKYGELIPRFTKYMNQTKGCVSVADFWKDILKCSKEDMEQLLLSNPRLVRGVGGLEDRLHKAQLLFDSGFEKSELLKSSHCLLNVTYETLVGRLEEARMKKVNPLPITMIGQAEVHYRNALNNILEKKENDEKRFILLGELLGVDEGVLSHPVYKKTSLNSLKERIEYLINERGYEPEHIINYPIILQRIDIKRLEKAFRELEDAGLEDIQLATVVSYVNDRRIPAFRKGSHLSLAKKLGLDAHHLAHVSHPDFTALYQQSSSVLQRNVSYLSEECGFPITVILDLPVVLGHNHDLLVEHWRALSDKRSEEFTKWKNDKKKLLNLLQYDIEQSVNFKHSVLTSNVKS